MQEEVTLFELQMNQTADRYAIVGGHRIRVDYDQAVVCFYREEQGWGNLVGTVPVEKWSGDWLIRSVGRFFRLDYELAEDKAIASIQRNGYLSVQVLHKIGAANLYRRDLADRTWDYCVSFRGDIGFGPSVQGAVMEVRTKLKARLAGEQAEVTLKIGEASRFTEPQLVAFCQANGLIPGGQYTRQHLRQTILRQRKLNCEQFRNQLHYFEVRINCK